MAALSAARATLVRNTKGQSWHRYPVATSAVVYQGGLVSINTTSGRLVAATAATGRNFAGMATETATGVAGGTVLCKVVWNCEAYYADVTAIGSADIGALAYVSDDQTLGITAVGTAGVRVEVGEIIDVDSGGTWVALRTGYARPAAT